MFFMYTSLQASLAGISWGAEVIARWSAAHSRRPQKHATCSWPREREDGMPGFGCLERDRAAVFTSDPVGQRQAQADTSKFTVADKRLQ